MGTVRHKHYSHTEGEKHRVIFDATKKLDDAGTWLRRMMREQPYKVLACAVGAGYLLGRARFSRPLTDFLFAVGMRQLMSRLKEGGRNAA